MKNNPCAFTGRIAGADIRLLRIFKAVVEHGGFSAAEPELNISRAAISIAMADLEQRLSLSLCNRGRSGFSLTEQGQSVYTSALQLLSALDEFRIQVNSIHDHLRGDLNIGITDNLITMPSMKITHAIKALKKRGPEIHINIQMIPPDEIEASVLDGRLHTGVIPTLHSLSGLNYVPLYQEESFLYCGQSHPLFDVPDDEIQIDDINNHDAVLPSYTQTITVKTQLQDLKPTATATDREGIAFLILSGCYIGYLPDHFAKYWETQGLLRPILPKHCHYQTCYVAITRKQDKPNLVLKSYMEELLKLNNKAS